MNSIFEQLLAQATIGAQGSDETTTPPAGEAPVEQAPVEQAPAETGTETQTIQPAAPEGSSPEQPPQKPAFPSWLPLVLMFVVIYFLIFRGPRKKQQQQKQMLEAIKKGDRVRTIGGVLGTIVDVRDDEVVLKIDEASNTKMRVIRGAIGKVLTPEDQSEKK